MREHTATASPSSSISPLWICFMLVALFLLAPLSSSHAMGIAQEEPETVTPPAVRSKIDPTSLPYEESLDAPLEEGVKKVDFALIKGLAEVGLTSDAVSLKEVEVRHDQAHDYHFQRMELLLTKENQQVAVDALRASLATWATNATLTPLGDTNFVITVNGVPTHELTVFLPPEGVPMEQPAYPDGEVPETPATESDPTTPKARLAIVIDDLGESIKAADTLAALDYPVTFAIWPRSTHATKVAQIGSSAGKEIMVHQPMEPLRYPQVNPGPGSVFVKMTRDQIRTIISENLKLVPNAVGINNHMGSRFTQNATGVQAVLSELEEHSLFVLDSYTHPKSVFYSEALKTNIPSYKRNVFIDVIKDVNNIVYQLEKAERIALAKGQAIAIGHPMPETLVALRQWQTKRNPAIQIVSVHSLTPLTR